MFTVVNEFLIGILMSQIVFTMIKNDKNHYRLDPQGTMIETSASV